MLVNLFFMVVNIIYILIFYIFTFLIYLIIKSITRGDYGKKIKVRENFFKV